MSKTGQTRSENGKVTPLRDAERLRPEVPPLSGDTVAVSETLVFLG